MNKDLASGIHEMGTCNIKGLLPKQNDIVQEVDLNCSNLILLL